MSITLSITIDKPSGRARLSNSHPAHSRCQQGDGTMRRSFFRTALPIGVAAALFAASCGGDDDSSDASGGGDDTGGGSSDEPVTIEWWHIQNNDPGLSLWEDI